MRYWISFFFFFKFRSQYSFLKEFLKREKLAPWPQVWCTSQSSKMPTLWKEYQGYKNNTFEWEGNSGEYWVAQTREKGKFTYEWNPKYLNWTTKPCVICPYSPDYQSNFISFQSFSLISLQHTQSHSCSGPLLLSLFGNALYLSIYLQESLSLYSCFLNCHQKICPWHLFK